MWKVFTLIGVMIIYCHFAAIMWWHASIREMGIHHSIKPHNMALHFSFLHTATILNSKRKTLTLPPPQTAILQWGQGQSWPATECPQPPQQRVRECHLSDTLNFQRPFRDTQELEEDPNCPWRYYLTLLISVAGSKYPIFQLMFDEFFLFWTCVTVVLPTPSFFIFSNHHPFVLQW